ncbi:MAG: hydroxyacid dehydrogenase [Elusimicrobia bacterium]|jgi:D-3-phosphoglycerate dehydrogenase|nr:hydroxyacid dehydrogenase [Elusimicrobiota bacterium]
MQSAKILITDKLAPEGVKILKDAGFKVTEDASLNGEKLKEEISGYDGLIIRSGTQVTKDIIDAADNLKIIGRAGTGVDNIDIAAATKRGILVENVPAGNIVSVSEHTIALILGLLRNLPQAHQSLKEGRWDKKKYKGAELYGKNLGVIGMGKIGTEVVKRAKAFDLKISIYDPFVSEETAAEMGVKLVSLDELLKTSDVITVHAPVTEKTKGLISVQNIAKMKDGVYFINCARGAIVDEKALAEAVKNSKIAGAAVDVYENEPSVDSPLVGVDGIIHTPHLGASTIEAQTRVAVCIADQVREYLKNDKIIDAVNDIE